MLATIALCSKAAMANIISFDGHVPFAKYGLPQIQQESFVVGVPETPNPLPLPSLLPLPVPVPGVSIDPTLLAPRKHNKILPKAEKKFDFCDDDTFLSLFTN